MTNESILFGSVCFIAGAFIGVAAGATWMKNKIEQELKAEDTAPAHNDISKDTVATNGAEEHLTADLKTGPTKKEADYKDYTKIVKNEKYDIPSDEVEDISEEADDYENEHGGSVYVVDKNDYDADSYPTGPRDNPQLYYFTREKILCDEDGERFTEDSPTYIAFMDSDWFKANGEDVNAGCYIVNNQEEVDYIVTIIDDPFESWYPNS